jgi:hypothetical protein
MTLSCNVLPVAGTKPFSFTKGVLKEKDGNEYYFYVSINFPFLKRHLSKWGMYFDGSIKV